MLKLASGYGALRHHGKGHEQGELNETKTKDSHAHLCFLSGKIIKHRHKTAFAYKMYLNKTVNKAQWKSWLTIF